MNFHGNKAEQEDTANIALQQSCIQNAQETNSPLPNKHLAQKPYQRNTENTNPSPDHHRTWRFPPEFWDQLSTIPLERDALQELDRRTCIRRLLPSFPFPPTEFAPDIAKILTPAIKRDLAQFARYGGPDLNSLRGYPPPATISRGCLPTSAMSSSSPSRAIKFTDLTTNTQSGTTKSRKSISPYNRGFEQHLEDYGIHTTWNSQKPNMEEVKVALAVRRPSLSYSLISEGAFKTFQDINAKAKNEKDVCKHVFPTISGPWEYEYPFTEDMAFGNLEPLTDGTIVAPKPDIAFGALPNQLNPTIRNELQYHIIPSTATDRVMAPNFFIEAKGPDGSAAVMLRQARYDGAVGARAMHSLQNYGAEEAVYDGQPYAYSTTYHDGQLKMYAHHATPPATFGSRPEYHMTQINSYAMAGERQTFVEGATAYRNLRDLARRHRETFIRHANSRCPAGALTAQKPSFTANSRSENDSSSDKFVDCKDYHIVQNCDGPPLPEQPYSQQFYIHTSGSVSADTKQAARTPTTSTPSLTSTKGWNTPTAALKRHRDPQSSPTDSYSLKKRGRDSKSGGK